VSIVEGGEESCRVEGGCQEGSTGEGFGVGEVVV